MDKNYYLNGVRYRFTSDKNGGQYSGPCLFSGDGKDRFTIEPATNRWFCRSMKCIGCTAGDGRPGYRYGAIDENREAMKPQQVKTPTSNMMKQAIGFSESMDQEGLKYLMSRGIERSTSAKFMLGMRFGKQITIPLTYKLSSGKTFCQGIKCRWIPWKKQHDASSYVSVRGSNNSGIYNFDVLKNITDYVVVANSLFDVMTIDQLGIPCVGPFTGEGKWESYWTKQYFHVDTVVNIGDRDEPTKDGIREGERYMVMRSVKLAYGDVKRVINVMPPGGYSDINEAYTSGEDIKKFIQEALGENWSD